MKLNGAEIMANVLIEQGATTVFGYPGGAVLPIYDALYKYQDKITHYLTAHEQGAAHAADGFARASGNTGVVIATSGPGATNLVTGLATAFMDSVPMVAITGNVPNDLIGKDSFQEVYTVGVTMPITKHNFFVQRVEDLAETLRSAFKIANSGRKGPVLVDIPKDVQNAEYSFTPEQPFVEEKKLTVSEESIWKIAEYLQDSKRPIVCFGGGVRNSEAWEELLVFLEKTKIPAVHTLMATGLLGWQDPLNLGLVGMHGLHSCNLALDSSDLLIAVGFRFSDRVALSPSGFAPHAKIIHIDIDPSEIGKNVRADHAVISDIGLVLQKLNPVLPELDFQSWHKQVEGYKKQDYIPEKSKTTIKPQQLIEKMSEMAGEEAVYVTDVGQHQMWAAQYIGKTNPRSFLTSGGLGTMGFGYGAALGAKISQKDRTVVHITGDGSFHMNLNEACTAASYDIAVISIIMNNNVLGMVRQWQRTFYENRFSNTTLNRKTDYVKVAEGFGLAGYRATNMQEFETVFAAALQSGKPAWIECVMDKDEKVLPMIPSGGTVRDIIVN